jgi:FSR family fosmidomycin resistance protein-like MFS transporter
MTGLSSPESLKVESNERVTFQAGRVTTIISAHFIQDTYAAFLAPLLPSLIEKLSLTYTEAGFLSAIMQVPSIINPIIGYIDDKVSLRILIILSPAITATMMSCLGIAPSYISLLVLLFITGLSIAAFHAISPAMVARVSGQEVGRGMSLFMAAGELGRTAGPLIASWALLTLTLDKMAPIAIPGWIASLIIYLRFRGIPVHIQKQSGFREILPLARRLYLPLFGIVFFRNFLITGMGVYLPTLLTSEGAGIWKANASLSIYQIAGVIGAIIGGTVSDRFGRKPVLFIVSLFAPLTVLLFLNMNGWILIPLLVLSGFLGLASQPVILAIVQDHLPNHRSVGNGLLMAINFICFSFSAVAIGMLADKYGLQQAFQVIAIAGLLAAPLIFFLPAHPKHPLDPLHQNLEGNALDD